MAAGVVRHVPFELFLLALEFGHGQIKCRLGGVEPHAPTRESFRVDAAEHNVGVGDGRLTAAMSVARRPGRGAGAVRPDRDALHAVDPRDRTATRADLHHLDHWDAQRQAAAFLETIDARDFEHAAVTYDRIRALGARLVESGNDLSDAIDAAEAYAAREAAFFLHDARDPDVPIGAGTIGLEIVDQLPAVDVIYAPMGDTALIRGVASAAKQRRPSIRIVGVVAERAPAYFLSWQRGGADSVVETATCDTIADGLAIRRPLAPNVAAIVELLDDVVMVSEEEMISAIES